MEYKLQQKELVCSDGVNPDTVTGTDELLQRAMIRLCVPAGEFPYNAALGSRFQQMDLDEADEAELLATAREALEGLSGVRVTGMEKSANYALRSVKLTVYLDLCGQTAYIELEQKEEN